MERGNLRRSLGGPLVVMMAIGLAGCGGSFGDQDRDGLYLDLAGEIVTYRCDDDRSFQAAYARDLGSVQVDTVNGNYRLVLADRDRRGYEYRGQSGDDVRLLVEPDNTRLRIEDRPDFTDCRISRT